MGLPNNPHHSNKNDNEARFPQLLQLLPASFAVQNPNSVGDNPIGQALLSQKLLSHAIGPGLHERGLASKVASKLQNGIQLHTSPGQSPWIPEPELAVWAKRGRPTMPP